MDIKSYNEGFIIGASMGFQGFHIEKVGNLLVSNDIKMIKDHTSKGTVNNAAFLSQKRYIGANTTNILPITISPLVQTSSSFFTGKQTTKFSDVKPESPLVITAQNVKTFNF